MAAAAASSTTLSDDTASPPQRPPLTATSRRSYFQEAPMEESTPTSSVHHAAEDEDGDGDDGAPFREPRLRARGSGKLVLRVVNAALHLGLCCVLLAIMVEFMVRSAKYKQRPRAIALITLVATDACLDVYSVARLRKPWQGWAVVLRLLLALGHVAQFLVYVGFRRVFPRHYTYWRMGAEFSEPVVYLLLIVLGIWNLLHVVVHRYTLGSDLRQYAAWVGARRQRQSQPDRSNGDGPSHASPRSNQRRDSDTRGSENGSDLGARTALIAMDAEEKGSRMMMTSHSWGSGESSLQGTIVADGRHETPRTGRRASITAADDTESRDDATEKTGLDIKI